MKIALLGAGALGQPFGHYLSEGGAEVTYVVKEKYREATQRGFRLHRHRTFGGPVTEEFDEFDVLVDYDRVAEIDWDHVWLCVSSTAIRGEWLEAFLEAIGETTLVSIQPGLGDRDYLERAYPADRLVSVRVSLIAYPTPLPGEDLPDGDTAYYMPPGEKIWCGGDRERALEVAASLDDGGCPSGIRDDVRAFGAFNSALMETAVAGLELADWSLADFRSGSVLDLALRAGREAIEIVSEYYDASPPMSVRLGSRAGFMRMGLPFASMVMPFDLEAYLEEHFTKVSDQTRQELETFVGEGRERGVPVEALEKLHGRLEARHA